MMRKWIPVEACPAAGKLQQILGTVPTTTDSAGRLWFDTRYTRFDREVFLPPNQPSVAEIRAVPGVERLREVAIDVRSREPVSFLTLLR